MKKIIDEKGNVVAEVLGIAETNPHYDERLSANGGAILSRPQLCAGKIGTCLSRIRRVAISARESLQLQSRPVLAESCRHIGEA